MKRSEINKLINFSLNYFKKNKFYLPEWSKWKLDKWANNKILAKKLCNLQLGWDITDFGRKNFSMEGLILFSLRNGDKNNKKDIQYAEKLLLMLPGQKIPYHFHKLKKEDIINKFGGKLELKFYKNNKEKIEIDIDRQKKILKCKQKLEIKIGQSVYIPPKLIHSFAVSKKNKSPLIIGEVSSINDDDNDNYFPNKNIRFSKIIEDEKIKIPTWKDLLKII